MSNVYEPLEMLKTNQNVGNAGWWRTRTFRPGPEECVDLQDLVQSSKQLDFSSFQLRSLPFILSRKFVRFAQSGFFWPPTLYKVHFGQFHFNVHLVQLSWVFGSGRRPHLTMVKADFIVLRRIGLRPRLGGGAAPSCFYGITPKQIKLVTCTFPYLTKHQFCTLNAQINVLAEIGRSLGGQSDVMFRKFWPKIGFREKRCSSYIFRKSGKGYRRKRCAFNSATKWLSRILFTLKNEKIRNTP